MRREPVPDRRDLPRLLLTGVGVVIGFPLFSSLALRELSSAHASVIVGLLPAATAAFAVPRGGERPGRGFWAAAAAGLAAVLAFAATQGAERLAVADLLRARGGRAVRVRLRRGRRAVAPLRRLAGDLLGARADRAGARAGGRAWRSRPTACRRGADAWLGFAYVALFSMFLGFFAWYRGLALGGIARIGQIQLAQPVLTLVWAALLLGEQVTAATVAAALAVLACVGLTQRARVSRPRTRPAACP